MTGDKPNVRTITVSLDDSGTLTVKVVDSGPIVEDFRGTDEIEFWYGKLADCTHNLDRPY